MAVSLPAVVLAFAVTTGPSRSNAQSPSPAGSATGDPPTRLSISACGPTSTARLPVSSTQAANASVDPLGPARQPPGPRTNHRNCRLSEPALAGGRSTIVADSDRP